ncbi:hypothetical protein WJX81_002756 [Elliptochloris bilobata]|uniref:Uncharacterized protein n=1 Tax=Elliptochloris bilobata TaxID=381761 RepID=A0AAW1RTX9_9CHLO
MQLAFYCTLVVVVACFDTGRISAAAAAAVETVEATDASAASSVGGQQAVQQAPLCWQAIPGCLECDERDPRYCARCGDEWNLDIQASTCVCNVEHVASTDLRSCIPLADVAQVCLGHETSCTPGQQGVTLRNLTVGTGGADIRGPAAFHRPAVFGAHAMFTRGLSVRLQKLPPFERRLPLNAIPHGTSFVDVGAMARHNNGVVALPTTPERGQRISIMSAQRYRLIARGGGAINGRGEASRVDVPADVLVDCICLVRFVMCSLRASQRCATRAAMMP